ncbi:hypothetical protein DSCOOX_14900 [Desulfosarcina ovata subsp. ovata]|uniref:6-hydroxymethylpterin diphosphokinase MptE-like domain-containing protein n=2 Tax=Desulfosarcina ovata TaxID=83564 RepID=A0A5K8A8C3_9BACT|nr:hypothetical protein DSCOOX_14900 [Desulfosarcina ovata subsp. ovata]
MHRIKMIRDIWNTTRRFGKQMLENSIANLPSLLSGTPMGALRDKFKGVPAICFAAGPSLDEALPEIKKTTNALLIACDSAVGSLLKENIQPHVVATADSHLANIKKLRPHMHRLTNTMLVFGVESNPDNVRCYLGRRRTGVTAYNKLITNWLAPNLKLGCQFPQMTSVMHLAVSFATAIGAEPIILVGVDLAYIGKRSHSSGAVFNHIPEKKSNLIAINGVSGDVVHAPPPLVADRIILEQNIDQSQVRMINTSLRGAFIENSEIKSIAEVAETELGEQLNVNALMESIAWEPASDNERIIAEVARLIERLAGFASQCEKQSDAVRQILKRHGGRYNFAGLESDSNGLIGGDERFQNENNDLISLIEESFLDEIQPILKQSEINDAKTKTSKNEKIVDQLTNIQLKYTVFRQSANTLIGYLKTVAKNFAKMKKQLDLFATDTGNYQHRIDLAECFRDCGEIWQAVNAYLQCIDTDPQRPVAYKGLIQLYIDAQLWAAANEMAATARTIFPDDEDVGRLEKMVENHIDSIFYQMNAAWKTGDVSKSKRLLDAYKLLRDDDPQVREIETDIDLLENSSLEKPDMNHAGSADLQARFKQAVQAVKNQDIERGVGILEGLCLDFPDLTAKLRSQIGDCRILQKNYKSALWNFLKAWQHGLRGDEMKRKIDLLRSYG